MDVAAGLEQTRWRLASAQLVIFVPKGPLLPVADDLRTSVLKALPLQRCFGLGGVNSFNLQVVPVPEVDVTKSGREPGRVYSFAVEARAVLKAAPPQKLPPKLPCASAQARNKGTHKPLVSSRKAI